uniref:Uncharacterized protein n=1 Tax=Arundo donax TaxID=35708 RepID=A0A0A9DA92_ARUDO
MLAIPETSAALFSRGTLSVTSGSVDASLAMGAPFKTPNLVVDPFTREFPPVTSVLAASLTRETPHLASCSIAASLTRKGPAFTAGSVSALLARAAPLERSGFAAASLTAEFLVVTPSPTVASFTRGP